MVSVFLSLENFAAMKTKRELEWNAWEENPKSIKATVQCKKAEIDKISRTKRNNLPWTLFPLRLEGIETSIVNSWWNAIFGGTLSSFGRATVMYGGFKYSIRSSLVEKDSATSFWN
jgi:hypothetical protein